MSVVFVLFLFDEQAFEQLVRPAIADFVPGSSAGVVDLLRRATEGTDPGAAAPDTNAGYDRIFDELRADAQGRPRNRERPSSYEVYSGRAHPGIEDARESARFLLEELRGSSFPPNTRSALVWSATRALVDNYCIPWSRFREPMFRMTGSAGESYLLEHGESPDALLSGGKDLELAKNWDVHVLLPSEARAWAERLSGWGPPIPVRKRADYDRLLALFDEASKGQGLRLA